MFIIAGLGNPKKDMKIPDTTWVFEVIDALADHYGIRVIDRKHRALGGEKA